MNKILKKFRPLYNPLLALLWLVSFVPPALAQTVRSQPLVDDAEIEDSLLKRDLADGRVRLLNITTNFFIPYGASQYFARLYYFPKNPEEVEFRDEQIAEEHFDYERKLKSPRHYIAYESSQFKAPLGLDLVTAPKTLVNLTSESDFSLKKGGWLTLYVKVPLQAPIRIKVLIENSGRRLRTLMVNQAGQKIVFDQIQIDAKTLFGRANIMRGISAITFLKAGKPVSSLFE